jgi:hypothetical protein
MDVTFVTHGLEVIQSLLERMARAAQSAGNARAVVGTNVKYARFIEEGTKFMRARPYLQPALDQEQGAINQRIGNAVMQVANGANESTLIDALYASGLSVQAGAERIVAVRTGNLRRSLYTEVFGR